MITAHMTGISCNIGLSIIASSLVSTSTFWLQPVARSFNSSCKPTSSQFSHLHTLGIRSRGTWLRIQPPSTIPFRIVAESSKCWEHPFKWHGSTSWCWLQECDPSSASSLVHLWPLSSRRATGPAFLITCRLPPRSIKLETKIHIYFLYTASSYSTDIFSLWYILWLLLNPIWSQTEVWTIIKVSNACMFNLFNTRLKSVMYNKCHALLLIWSCKYKMVILTDR